MKYVTLAALLWLPVVCSAQLTTEPTKKSETVVVVLPGTDEAAAFRHCAHALQDQGWRIEASDPVLYTITTDWVELKGFFVRQWQATISIRAGEAGEVHAYLRCKARQQGTADSQAMGMNDADGNYVYDISKRTNAGKDWKMMMAVAEVIGSEFLYR